MRRQALLWLLFLACAGQAAALPTGEGASVAQTRVKQIHVSPEVLTLPGEGFHYDPLITVLGDDGEPVWVDVRSDLHATSSNLEVATVDRRIRIKTARPGKATITIGSTADPRIKQTLDLTVLEATVANVEIAGDRAFDMTVGETRPLEATARLSTGHTIPHAEYSSDLDVVVGKEFATLVDGLGLSALHPCPPNSRIAIGFWRGGATAECRLSVKACEVSHLEIRLGGQPWQNQELVMPGGTRAVLEVIGIFHDGSKRLLSEGQEYSVFLPDETDYQFHRVGSANGYLTCAAPGEATELTIRLRESVEQKLHHGHGKAVKAKVRAREVTGVSAVSAAFTNYPHDKRLLAPGYSRELTVLAEVGGVTGYRVSAYDDLGASVPAGMDVALVKSLHGWPALRGASGAGALQLRYGQRPVVLDGIEVVHPQRLEVTPWSDPISVELGGNLSWRTLVDYGDGAGPQDRTMDYPVVESRFDLSRVLGTWHPQSDRFSYFFLAPARFQFQALDAAGYPLQPLGPGANTLIRVEAGRQSGFP